METSLMKKCVAFAGHDGLPKSNLPTGIAVGYRFRLVVCGRPNH